MALSCLSFNGHGDTMWIDGRGGMVLGATECRRLLAVAAQAGWIGRIGIPTDQAPVVIPVNFVMRDRHVAIRIGAGFIAREADDRLVAFEVDHVDDTTGTAWSVLVRGLATLKSAPTDADLATAAHPLVPVPGDMILEVRPDILTGRRFAVHSDPRVQPPHPARARPARSGSAR
jgi:hypothetical protein